MLNINLDKRGGSSFSQESLSPRVLSAPSSPWQFFRKEVNKDLAREKLAKRLSRKIFDDQAEQVKNILRDDRLINFERLDQEVDWYYHNMGIHPYYFETNSAEEIAQDITSLYSAKCLAHLTGGELELKLQSSRKGRHMFVARSIPGSRFSPCSHIEAMIEQNYLGSGSKLSKKSPLSKEKIIDPNRRFSVKTYRTSGTVSEDSSVHLRFYFLSEPNYPSSEVDENETDLDKVSDKDFLKNLANSDRPLYENIMKKSVATMSPIIELVNRGDEFLLVIGYRHYTTHSYFSGLMDLYHSYGLYSTRKYVDQFSNGITIFSIYLTEKIKGSFDGEKKKNIVYDANLIYILPKTSVTPLFRDAILNAHEYAYAYAVWKFAFHFLERQAAEFADLAFALKDKPMAAQVLEQIKVVVRKEAYTEGRILETIFNYPQVVKELYSDFAGVHYYSPKTLVRSQSVSNSESLIQKIQKTVPGELDRLILGAFVTFNKHLLKTNFYKSTKVALAFRFDASFLSKEDFPTTPFGLFFVVGPEFRGFHIRMKDIARGGIRLIKSHNFEGFIQNVTTVFKENYNLASTQDRKNKDIAEGGSKGTILLSLDQQDKPFEAFSKYIDSLLDLLLPNSDNEQIVDLYRKQEILFMGPDENTANYMDWASQHAKSRGYAYWKAFTTGKSTTLGGIPHDLYGMTTRSIHQYVLGTLEKLGLNEAECTKFQTGGPDGDLGSNEIKISKDKTISIVDGSGVLCDPKGIDRAELLVLATGRKMAREFNMSKLSSVGFFVDINDVDKTLPDGTVVANGMDYRNTFHLNPLIKADIFVPCGGRPEAVNMSNVKYLLDENTKKPLFKVIVEGANLFFSQEARLTLEKNGVVVFKDASANKGGVTSSSLEVLAALSLSDEEFAANMNGVSDFYNEYVTEVQHFIESNARLEFECIWEESKKSGTSRCLLSDVISNKINSLSASISESDLWNNEPLRRKVMQEAFPKKLQALVGLDNMIKRVPENYLRAVFGTYLGSRYIYKNGLSSTPEFSFFNFISNYTNTAK